MNVGQPHILSVTDVQRGIQALAASLLGDASQWTTLVQVNNLSPPYMTTNPADVYGPPIATIVLSAPIDADATDIVISNQPQSTNTLYFSSSGANRLVAETITIRSYDGTTFTFSTPLQNSYPQGTQVQLFSTYITGNTQVLLPGDVIYIPVSVASFSLTTKSQLTDTFGSDIAYPVSFSSGDVNTVQGINTFIQRATAALQTALNSLPLHLDFGSRLQANLGSGSQQTKWSAFVTETLMSLPEISNVQNVSVTKSGNTLNISATMYTATSQTAIQLSNIALTLAS